MLFNSRTIACLQAFMLLTEALTIQKSSPSFSIRQRTGRLRQSSHIASLSNDDEDTDFLDGGEPKSAAAEWAKLENSKSTTNTKPRMNYVVVGGGWGGKFEKSSTKV
jgi:hypothetical protein